MSQQSEKLIQGRNFFIAIVSPENNDLAEMNKFHTA